MTERDIGDEIEEGLREVSKHARGEADLPETVIEIATINRFRGEYRFLSNFYPSPIRMDGEIWPTVEHAYQASKTHDPQVREIIREADSPGEAKRMGRKCEIRDDWEDVKVDVMGRLLEAKFSIPSLREKLLDTHPARLVEGNTWGDDFWGVTDNGEGEGQNILGKLLMLIRKRIRVELG